MALLIQAMLPEWGIFPTGVNLQFREEAHFYSPGSSNAPCIPVLLCDYQGLKLNPPLQAHELSPHAYGVLNACSPAAGGVLKDLEPLRCRTWLVEVGQLG